jgi:lipopolysaccharide biosynthesis regulator YciM
MQYDPLYRRSCLRELLALYQKTQEWDKAAAIANLLQNEGVDDAKPALAHFYCELAENLAQNRQYDEALQKVEFAQQLDPQCVRAFLIAIRFHVQTGHTDKALQGLHDIIQHDAGLFSEALPLVQQLNLSADALQTLLQRALTQGAGASVVVALADSVLTTQGDRAAGEVLIQALKTRPSLRELQRLVDLYLPQVQGSTQSQLQLLHDVLQRLLDRLPVYRCQNCGFAGKKMHWRCPTCKRWNSVRPVTGVEGE